MKNDRVQFPYQKKKTMTIVKAVNAMRQAATRRAAIHETGSSPGRMKLKKLRVYVGDAE